MISKKELLHRIENLQYIDEDNQERLVHLETMVDGYKCPCPDPTCRSVAPSFAATEDLQALLEYLGLEIVTEEAKPERRVVRKKTDIVEEDISMTDKEVMIGNLKYEFGKEGLKAKGKIYKHNPKTK